MQNPLTLVGRNFSPYTRRVAIALRWLGVPFDQIKLSPITALDDVKAWNPIGRVPVLVIADGERLIDSTAIIDHVLETYDGAHRLLASSGAARRRDLQLTALVSTLLDKAVLYAYEDLKRPPEYKFMPVQQGLADQVMIASHEIDRRIADHGIPDSDDDMTIATMAVGVAYTFLPAFTPLLAELCATERLDVFCRACEATQAFRAHPLER